MGKLLSLLARDESTCCTPKSYDVFLDFENALPTEIEREVYDEVDLILKESEAVLAEIQCYKVKEGTGQRIPSPRQDEIACVTQGNQLTSDFYDHKRTPPRRIKLCPFIYTTHGDVMEYCKFRWRILCYLIRGTSEYCVGGMALEYN